MTTALRDRLRDRLVAPKAPWPPRIDELLEAGRALAAPAGDRLTKATEIVTELSAYVGSLPPAQRSATARKLVAALTETR